MRSVLLVVLIALAIPTPAGAGGSTFYSRVRTPIDYDEDAFLNAGAGLESISVDLDGTRNVTIVTRQGLDIQPNLVGLGPSRIVDLQSQAMALAPGDDLGDGCGIPSATQGIVGIRGSYIGQSFTCDDFFGRFAVRGNPDIFPGRSGTSPREPTCPRTKA